MRIQNEIFCWDWIDCFRMVDKYGIFRFYMLMIIATGGTVLRTNKIRETMIDCIQIEFNVNNVNTFSCLTRRSAMQKFYHQKSNHDRGKLCLCVCRNQIDWSYVIFTCITKKKNDSQSNACQFNCVFYVITWQSQWYCKPFCLGFRFSIQIKNV